MFEQQIVRMAIVITPPVLAKDSKYSSAYIYSKLCLVVDLSDNLNNSFGFARKLFSDFGRLVIIIVLDLIPIVNLIVTGYASRVLKESPGAASPPKPENYSDMFMDGLKIAIATIIYMLIPLILIGAGIGSVFMEHGPDFMWSGFTPAYTGLLGGAGIVLVLIGLLVAFGEILGIIEKIGWGKYLAWLVLIVVIAAIVGAIAGALPFVGWIIAAIIGPALTVFYFRSLGLLYSQ
jgi:hypothetical protein